MFNDMKRWFFAACAAAFAVFGISACKSAPEEQHTSYETVTISPVDLEVPIKFSSTMTGRKDVSIIPQTSGQLTSVCVNPGQKVTKGQVLFRIDDRKARQLLSAREADLLGPRRSATLPCSSIRATRTCMPSILSANIC